MKAYSVDLRQRVLAALDRGMTRAQVIDTFAVSLATIKCWRAQQRDTADLTPKTPPGRLRTITVEQHAVLWAQLEADNDATLAMHTQWWNEVHGSMISERTMSRAITRLGWTRKKRRWEPPSVTNSSAKPIASVSRNVRPTNLW